MPSAFKADAAAGVNVVFQYSISGPGGGDWYMIIKDQTCTLEAGTTDSPTTNITGTSEPGGVNIASSAKAAVHAWAKGLSRVLAPDGITVNCLPPGRINSEQILNKVHPDPDERRAFIEANIPAGYFGEPEDMANLIAFLCSPLARYITGEVIHVDGGMRRFAF